MKTAFKTEHESIYEIDYDNKTWIQLEAGHDNDGTFDLRSTSGPFIYVSEIEVGCRVSITTPPYIEGATFRFISTSPVVSIERSRSENTDTTSDRTSSR